MNRFIRLLRIIILSRGFIILNEQFLIRICFVRFLSRVILYSGDDIKKELENKRNELLNNQKEFIEKKQRLKKEFLIILEKRIGLRKNLLILNNNLRERNEIGFKNKLLQEETNFNNIILNELELLFQFEQLLIPRIQNELINNNKIRRSSIKDLCKKRIFLHFIPKSDDSEEEDKKYLETLFDDNKEITTRGFDYIEINLLEEESNIEDLKREF